MFIPAGVELADVSFRFTILDHRGLVAVVNGQSVVGNAFNSATVDKRQVVAEGFTIKRSRRSNRKRSHKNCVS